MSGESAPLPDEEPIEHSDNVGGALIEQLIDTRRRDPAALTAIARHRWKELSPARRDILSLLAEAAYPDDIVGRQTLIRHHLLNDHYLDQADLSRQLNQQFAQPAAPEND